MKNFYCTLTVLVCSFVVAGCGNPKEESVAVPKNDVMQQVKSTLENYAKGQPLASEVASFDYMIDQVKKTAPDKADILKAGLDDIKNTKGSPKAKAQALLQKLGLDSPSDKK